MLRIQRPSPAMVVACAALVVALGGTGVAAVKVLVPRNSVGSLQVIDHSLLAKDFKTPPKGPQGVPGAAGPAGAAGAAGAAGPAGPAGAAASKSWAVVKSDGTLVRQSGVSSVSHTSNGRYTVGFSSDISACAWLATATNTGSGTLSGVEISTNKDTNTTVRVATSFGGGAADEDFAIAAFC